MRIEDAVALIRSSVVGREGAWADLGAGRGTFTRALVEILGAGARVYAVDHDAGAVAALESWAKERAPGVQVIQADFATESIDVADLDGILLANSLHFVKDHGTVLARLVRLLRPGGRVVLIEYDRRQASRWVPYPVSIASLRALADAAGLGPFTVQESRPSNYEGIIYAAFAPRR